MSNVKCIDLYFNIIIFQILHFTFDIFNLTLNQSDDRLIKIIPIPIPSPPQYHQSSYPEGHLFDHNHHRL